MFCIKIADLIVGIENKNHYIEYLCKEYLTDCHKPDFVVCATQEEIEEEKRTAESQSDTLSESAVIYRKICLKMISYQGFLLHAAVIERDGYAYAFLAGSGTGKTTHISLWEKAFTDSVHIINGDKPILRFLDNKLYVYGTPWNGKENKGNNMKCHIKAFAFIEQDTESSIRKLEQHEITDRLFRQLLIPGELQAYDQLLQMVEEMIADSCFYLLKCNMEEEAAVIAYKEMRKAYD